MFNRKKKLIEILKNNYKIVFDRKKELENENVEYQKEIRGLKINLSVAEKDNEDLTSKNLDLENMIKQLKKDNKTLKMKLTKTTNILNGMKKVEVAPSIEEGNKIIEKIREKKGE